MYGQQPVKQQCAFSFPPPPQAVLEVMRTAARDAALFRLRQKLGPLLPLEVG